jgi:hypothetical protein
LNPPGSVDPGSDVIGSFCSSSRSSPQENALAFTMVQQICAASGS